MMATALSMLYNWVMKGPYSDISCRPNVPIFTVPYSSDAESYSDMVKKYPNKIAVQLRFSHHAGLQKSIAECLDRRKERMPV
jgi:hypothetical protein